MARLRPCGLRVIARAGPARGRSVVQRDEMAFPVVPVGGRACSIGPAIGARAAAWSVLQVSPGPHARLLLFRVRLFACWQMLLRRLCLVRPCFVVLDSFSAGGSWHCHWPLALPLAAAGTRRACHCQIFDLSKSSGAPALPRSGRGVADLHTHKSKTLRETRMAL